MKETQTTHRHPPPPQKKKKKKKKKKQSSSNQLGSQSSRLKATTTKFKAELKGTGADVMPVVEGSEVQSSNIRRVLTPWGNR